MARKTKKTERDELSDQCRMLTKLLMHEVSNGIIPLPKGVDVYVPPPIPFAERRAFLDSVNKSLLIDMKVNPESEESVFDKLKEEMNAGKRNGAKNGRGRSTTESIDPGADTADVDPDDFDILGVTH